MHARIHLAVQSVCHGRKYSFATFQWGSIVQAGFILKKHKYTLYEHKCHRLSLILIVIDISTGIVNAVMFSSNQQGRIFTIYYSIYVPEIRQLNKKNQKPTRYNMYNSFCTIHVFIVIRLVIKLAKIKWAVLLLVFELFVFLTIITTI